MSFNYYNANPLDEIEQDCVCRAISLGLNIPYEIVEEKLELVAQLMDCETLCVSCYKFLLDEVYSLERIVGFKGLTIREFLEMKPIGVFIIRVKGHLTCVIDGVIYDTWDCSNEVVDIIWKC